MNAPEQIAATYLRLNGFFLMPNFTVFEGEQHTDIDVVGLRAPNACEKIDGHQLLQDDRLFACLNAENKWLAVAVQVKGNRPRKAKSGPPGHKQIEYVKPLVGAGTELMPMYFSLQNIEVSVCPGKEPEDRQYIHVGLQYALRWIYQRFDRMEAIGHPLTKPGSWTWSESSLSMLLYVRRVKPFLDQP